VEYRLARADELTALAVLRWQDTAESTTPAQSCDDFIPVFLDWVNEVKATHTPFVAVDDVPIGMAWLARVARTPLPGGVRRVGGDVQTVYIRPEHRNRGIGAELVRTLLRHAWDQGMTTMTVSSSTRAVPLYQRLGFTGLPPHLRMEAQTYSAKPLSTA
jgi:GNAT superfamily N-acetyltransferase